MERRLLLLLCCLLSFPLFSQTFKGRVVSSNGEPIPYASLYLRELQSGFTTDDNGYFQTTVKSGQYICDVSSLGYVQQTFTLDIPAGGLEKNITLAERVYRLSEVHISKNSEDPAYAVMRQAIARAPYYRTHVKSYTAETYLKGTGKLKKIPGILKLSKEVREESKKYMGKLFLIEEQRKVTFSAPDKWDNEILAYSNSFPEEVNINLETTNINFYQPKLFGMISPLNPSAFSYYRFKLEGFYKEGNYMINKVKVIPKKDNPNLISGYLYIPENLWCVSNANITVNLNTIKANVVITCNEIKPAVFLPTSISIQADFSAMGVKAEASYLSAIQYNNIETVSATLASSHINTNTTPSASNTSVTKKTTLSKKQQKVKEKIEELTSKEELSNREAYKLAKLVSQSVELQDTTKSKHKYEKKLRTYNAQTDSLANKRDSTYWKNVRSVPLRPEEMESYAYKEKLTMMNDSVKKDSTHKSNFGKKFMNTLLMGQTFYSENKRAWIKVGDLISFVPEYNFVDGLWVGATLKAGIKLNESSNLNFIPKAYYTTARKEWIGTGAFELDYSPRRLGKLSLEGGITSTDFNQESGESRRINMLASLLFARNDIKFFERKYLFIKNDVELINSMMLSAKLSWERRSALENHAHRSIFRREGSTNIPVNPAYTDMPRHDALKTSFAIEYTPAHYYRMIRGKKVYEPSRYPTFRLAYERAFPHGENSTLASVYHRIELSAYQQINFGLFNTLSWYINGGTFQGKENMQFPDYKHFATTKFPVTERSFSNGFSLLDNYAYSTSDHWGQANLAYYTPYLLIKHLPFLKQKRFDEALHVRSLWVYDRKIYTEVGYSLGMSTLLRAGVFVGFERLKYRSVGVSVSLPIGLLKGDM